MRMSAPVRRAGPRPAARYRSSVNPRKPERSEGSVGVQHPYGYSVPLSNLVEVRRMEAGHAPTGDEYSTRSWAAASKRLSWPRTLWSAKLVLYGRAAIVRLGGVAMVQWAKGLALLALAALTASACA